MPELSLTSPIRGCKSVTPDDSNDLPDGVTRAVYIGGSGNVKMTLINGDVATWINAADGQLIPCMVTRIWSTGTTATNIMALY